MLRLGMRVIGYKANLDELPSSQQIRYISKTCLTYEGGYMSEIEVVRLSSKGQVVIPKPVRGELGLKEGDRLLAYAKGGLLVMRKVEKEESLLSVLAAGSRKKVASLKLSYKEVDRAVEETREGSRKEA